MARRKKKAVKHRARPKGKTTYVKGHCRKKGSRKRYGKSHRGQDMPF